jgi:cinnamoyl-CoA:phenyllactate CoA-transferase
MPPFDVFYPTFMPLIGHPELVGNPRYTMKSITENKLHGEFIALIDEAFALKTAAEWVEILTKADIPHSVAQVWEEVLEDKQAWAIGAFENLKYLTGERAMVNIPVKLKASEKKKYARGPFLGEHSEKIVKGLGYTDEQLKDLHTRNIFSTWDDLREKCGGNLKDETSY